MSNGCFVLFAAVAIQVLARNVDAVQIGLTDCSQSSVHDNAQCGRAIDGNTDGNYAGGSCIHTNSELAWWKARAHQLTYFKTIRIFNRVDCCANRLNDFSIKIDGHECARYQSTQDFTSLDLPCNRVGRVLQIDNFKDTHLHFCEVQVFGHAMGGKQLKVTSCSQSSEVNKNGACFKAIDGNKNQNFYQGSCTHTGSGSSEWWEGRLEAEAFVTVVRIYNRLDCCSDSLNDIVITVGDQACASYKSGNYFSERTFECNAVGQAIRIQSFKMAPLSLCEVEVFGLYR